jgi:ppGpp synthetase/RelA/SpoT-type nucleotidyltranferase
MTSEGEALVQKYADRLNDLAHIARALKSEFEGVLAGQAGIERVEFRVKELDSFVEKALSIGKDGKRRYVHPFEEIEDQVGGRVMVFFRATIDEVLPRLSGRFAAVESLRKEPAAEAFGYESHHFVFQIPPEACPPGWTGRVDRIETFEVQVRTLFMHAWAELQHDIGYKGPELTLNEKRELAWAAASAWGADHGFQRVRSAIDARESMVSPARRARRATRF